MKIAFLIGGWSIAAGLAVAQAGSVSVFGNAPEVHGALALNSTTIRINGNPASEINLSDVLEANFGETPFLLNYFSSVCDAVQLPAGWKGVDLGHPSLTGSVSYTSGVFTLTGAGSDLQKGANEDQFYLLGQPCTGNAQLTARIKGVTGGATQVGPMLRENVDPLSLDFGMGISTQGDGLFRYRYTPAGHVGWNNFRSFMAPIWVRLTRSGAEVDAAVSHNGQNWEVVDQTELKIPASAWLGFFLDTGSDKAMGKATLDQVTLAPGPAEPETVPPGVLLRSGSFIAGVFHTTGPQSGALDHNGKTIALTTDQVSAVVTHSVTRHQIEAQAAQPGLIMKNGDYLAGDIQSMNGSFITIDSVSLGITSYYGDTVRASVLQPQQAQPSAYEVRLTDGSILRAASLEVTGGRVTIGEVSGLRVDVPTDEIAQVRAGLKRVQPLIDLAWKNAPPAPRGDTTAHPMAPNVVRDETADVQRWAGPNQEQILAAPVGIPLEVSLPGNYRALSLRIGLASDAPLGAQVKVRILVGGKEIASSPAYKAGDAPVLFWASLSAPKNITIVADSNSAGIKALFIDPMAIRNNEN